MGALAMAAALTEAAESMAADNLRLCGLSAGLVAEILERVPRVTVNGYPSGAGTDTLPHVISLSFEGIDGEALVYRLDAEGICVSAGSACTAGSPDPSHVITALGVPPETALGTIRISMGEGNTDGDVTRMAETIARLVADLRSV
jgi:cysteine desulfurase